MTGDRAEPSDVISVGTATGAEGTQERTERHRRQVSLQDILRREVGGSPRVSDGGRTQVRGEGVYRTVVKLEANAAPEREARDDEDPGCYSPLPEEGEEGEMSGGQRGESNSFKKLQTNTTSSWKEKLSTRSELSRRPVTRRRPSLVPPSPASSSPDRGDLCFSGGPQGTVRSTGSSSGVSTATDTCSVGDPGPTAESGRPGHSEEVEVEAPGWRDGKADRQDGPELELGSPGSKDGRGRYVEGLRGPEPSPKTDARRGLNVLKRLVQKSRSLGVSGRSDEPVKMDRADSDVKNSAKAANGNLTQVKDDNSAEPNEGKFEPHWRYISIGTIIH